MVKNRIMDKFISYTITISLSIFMLGCDVLFPDEKLSLQREDYNGNELRIDGYYYWYNKENNGTAVYFLFRNGVILLEGAFSSGDLNKIEIEMVKYFGKHPKTDWGVFIIDGNKIQYEKWIEGLSISAAIDRESGYIENDTTFRMTESYYSGTNKTEKIDRVYHFKQFSPKPDSTNTYIK